MSEDLYEQPIDSPSASKEKSKLFTFSTLPVPARLRKKRLREKIKFIALLVTIIVLVIVIIVLAYLNYTSPESFPCTSESKDINFAINITAGGLQRVTSKYVIDFTKHNDFTIYFWLKPRIQEDDKIYSFLMIRGLWWNPFFASIAIKGNEIVFGTMTTDMQWQRVLSLSFDDNSAAYDGEWIRVFIQIHNGGERYVLYSPSKMNGTVSEPLHELKLLPDSEGTVTVGQMNQGTNLFEGEITNLFIYSRLLTMGEMKESFEYNRSPPVDNVLVGWWEFDKQLGKTRIPV